MIIQADETAIRFTEAEYLRRWKREIATGPDVAVTLYKHGNDVECIAGLLHRPVDMVRRWIATWRQYHEVAR